MNSKIKLKLKRIWIIFLILFLTIPSFIIGQAFAYWSGLVSPPAAKADDFNANSGTGKELPVSFTWTQAYNTTFKLVPTGCYTCAYDQTIAREEIYHDYNINWSTSDITATQTNVNIALNDAKFYDLSTGTASSNYLNYINVKIMIGSYGTPGDHTTFAVDSGQTHTFNGQTLGNFDIMLNRNETKILRLAVFVTDFSRTDQTQYLDFRTTFMNSSIKVNLQYSVSNPNAYKTTNIWAQFDTTGVSNVIKGPYEYLTTGYLYNSKFKIYVKGATYNTGDILIVIDSTSPGYAEHYGYLYYVLQGGAIDLDNPATNHKKTWSRSSEEYYTENQYDYGDFVVHDNKIYRWNSSSQHHNFNPHMITVAPPTTPWALQSNDPTENFWFRHHIYTYGDVVKWWNGPAGAATTPIDLYYISIADVNIISNITTGGNKLSPAPGDYPSQRVTVSQFQTRSNPWASTTNYTAGQSVRVVNGGVTSYYIAILNTASNQSPTTHPNLWKQVTAPGL